MIWFWWGFFASLISYREWLEFSDVKHHLYTFIHFLSRFHLEKASQEGKFSCSRNSADNEASLFPRALSHWMSVLLLCAPSFYRCILARRRSWLQIICFDFFSLFYPHPNNLSHEVSNTASVSFVYLQWSKSQAL